MIPSKDCQKEIQKIVNPNSTIGVTTAGHWRRLRQISGAMGTLAVASFSKDGFQIHCRSSHRLCSSPFLMSIWKPVSTPAFDASGPGLPMKVIYLLTIMYLPIIALSSILNVIGSRTSTAIRQHCYVLSQDLHSASNIRGPGASGQTVPPNIIVAQPI